MLVRLLWARICRMLLELDSELVGAPKGAGTPGLAPRILFAIACCRTNWSLSDGMLMYGRS